MPESDARSQCRIARQSWQLEPLDPRKSRGGRPGIPVLISSYGLCGCKATLNLNLNSEHHFPTPSRKKDVTVNQCQEFASIVSNSHLAGIGHSSSIELLSLHYNKHTHTHTTTTTTTHARTHAHTHAHTQHQRQQQQQNSHRLSSRMPLMRISGRTFPDACRLQLNEVLSSQFSCSPESH